jgi:hypothetical protein
LAKIHHLFAHENGEKHVLLNSNLILLNTGGVEMYLLFVWGVSKSTAKPYNGKNPAKAMATKQNEVQQQHQLH